MSAPGVSPDVIREVLTFEEAARSLRISKAHLSAIINRRVPGVEPPRHVRLGRRILFRAAWLDEWLERSAYQVDAAAAGRQN